MILENNYNDALKQYLETACRYGYFAKARGISIEQAVDELLKILNKHTNKTRDKPE